MNCAKCKCRADIAAWEKWCLSPSGRPPFGAAHYKAIIAECLSCNPDAFEHKGASHVYIDSVGDSSFGCATDGGATGDGETGDGATGGETLGRDASGDFLKVSREYLAGRKARGEPLTPLSQETEDALLRFIHEFAQLEIIDLDILHGILNGMNCTEIASAFGYQNRAAVHSRLKHAIANPWIEAIYTRGQTYGAKMGRASKSWANWKEGRVFKRGYGGKPLSQLPKTDADRPVKHSPMRARRKRVGE